MTDHSQVSKGNRARGHNRKDGRGGRRRRMTAEEFENSFRSAGEWVQSWGEGLPAFKVTKGIKANPLRPVIIAKCDRADIELTWPAGTDLAQIRAEIDDKMLEIVQHGADLAAAPLFDEIDIDEYMTSGEGALWVTT